MKTNRKILFDIPALEMGKNFHAKDYCLLSSENKAVIGMCEIMGRRLSQEDCLEYSTDAALQFVGLPAVVVLTALQETFKELQNKYGQNNYGTTACVTTAWIDKEKNMRIWNANVGDSVAWLVTINKTSNAAQILQLNKLHSPNPEVNKEEYERTSEHAFQRNGDGPWALGDMFGSLSLTRAIGDNNLEEIGISHDPEFVRHVQLADPQEKYFLITACDGLTESNVLSAADIAEMMSTHLHLPLHEIALKLVLAAYKEDSNEEEVRSRDNISVAIAEITETPISLAIFDGHGGISKVGEGVSFDLGKYFYPTLQRKIVIASKDNDSTSHALATAIRNKDWAMAAYILILLDDCKNINAAVLKKINSHRSELTDAFINHVSHEEKKLLKNDLVRSVMNQNNALGIILHTPRYEVFFKFTQREHHNKKVTGSIFKICERLPLEVSDIEMENYSPEHLLGLA